jgi:hypothetical protein
MLAGHECQTWPPVNIDAMSVVDDPDQLVASDLLVIIHQPFCLIHQPST